ncbi:SNF2-related protein [Streptomyces sp. NPDC021100]|uniref:SNF2-related protein n=1 Tax=Streptomyces sp. NPDC021100 TaxID=3365114 RepID=UPI00379E3538
MSKLSAEASELVRSGSLRAQGASRLSAPRRVSALVMKVLDGSDIVRGRRPAVAREVARTDRAVAQALREGGVWPEELMAVIPFARELPQSCRQAWAILTADLGVAWTALEAVAEREGVELVWRSSRMEVGGEVVQLALRGPASVLVGPVGVGAGQRLALHQAVLGLLERLAQLGRVCPSTWPDRARWPGVEGWPAASGLVETAPEPRCGSDLMAGKVGEGRQAGARVLLDAFEEEERRAHRDVSRATARVAELEAVIAQAKQRREQDERRRAELMRLMQEARALEAGDVPEAERKAREAELLVRGREVQAALAASHAQALAAPGVAWELLEKDLPDGGWADFDGVVRCVGAVEGRSLWAAEIRGRQTGEAGACRVRFGESEAGGTYVWRGPVRLSQDDALDAAARLVWSDCLRTPVADPCGPQPWPPLVLPQETWPLVTDLAGSGALPHYQVEERGERPFTVGLSCQAGAVRVTAEGRGVTRAEAREQGARELLGVLMGELGFGGVSWSPEEAQERLGSLALEPWLGALKRKPRAMRGGGGRWVELSCRVGGAVVRVDAVAAGERAAELACAWLMVQRLGQGLKAAGQVLDPRPEDAAALLVALREQGVLEEAELLDGPGGREAVLATVVLGGRRLWAAGVDAGQAAGEVLAAVRCWMLAPHVAQASQAGAPHPDWLASRADRAGQGAGDGSVEGPEGLLSALRAGARLCAVALDGGLAAFVVVPPGQVRGRDKQGSRWRLWSERGLVQVPGPPLAVPAVAEALVGHGPEAGWDASAVGWREVLRFGCEAVAAGQVWPGVSADGVAVWRVGPFSDAQAGALRALARALPPWAHSEAAGVGKGAMASARATIERVLVALADGLVRGPGTTAVWGPSPLTSRAGGTVAGPVAQWLEAVEEIADAVPPPGVVLAVLPPPRPRRAVNTLRVQIRLRPPGRARQLVSLPALQEQLGREHPAVLRALRALSKAATCWPALLQAVQERADQIRVAPGEAALLLGQLGRSLARAGVEVQWPQQWAQHLRPVVVAGAKTGTGLSLGQLVDYRWQIRLDGTVLSAEECLRIAEAAGTLMWLHDRWVLIDATTAQRARGGWLRTGVPAGEALAAVLLGTVEVDTAHDEGESAELVAEGGLGELAALLSGDTFLSIEPPEHFAGQLWPYQQEGLQWLANVTCRFGALLGDDMGLGKSVQAIALMAHRRQSGASRGLPVLVVAPASMVLTWVQQVQKFAPTTPVRTYHGPGRSLAALEPDTVVVTSYGTLLQDRDLLAGRTYSLVVADEAQHVKNPASQRAQALARIPALTRVGLTGTPIENGLKDLWALLHWTNPQLFASLPHFMRRFGALEAGPAPDVAAAMNRLVGRVLLRRRKTDPAVSLQLPPKIDSTHALELTPAQVGLYTRTAQMAMDAVRKATGQERSGLVLRLLAHLRQVCNSPLHLKIGAADSGRLTAALDRYDPDRASREACKLAALDDLVPAIIDSGESVVMFSEFRTMAMLLHRHAAAWGLQPLLHTGAMTPGEKDAALTAFRRRAKPLLIVTYGSGGTGLDLTVASHAVLVDRPFNPARVAQATDRLHRPGQNRTVHAHHLRVAGTVEDKIDQMLAHKLGLLDALDATAVLDPTALTDEELHDLVALGAAR